MKTRTVMKNRDILDLDRPFRAAGTGGRKPGLFRENGDVWSP